MFKNSFSLEIPINRDRILFIFYLFILFIYYFFSVPAIQKGGQRQLSKRGPTTAIKMRDFLLDIFC